MTQLQPQGKKGVDYSVARPAPISIVMAGYQAAGRYLGGDSRCLTAPERDALHAVRSERRATQSTLASRLDPYPHTVLEYRLMN